ncbi:MAG: chromate transporter [Clostridia bacterium]|nr:chromate transporter [Clostridia bacterium]
MTKIDYKLLVQIYLSFFKLGSISFGGGYSMIPLIEREVVHCRNWVDKEKIVDIFAVSESLPGAIALNCSTFVGFSIARIPGAIAGLLGNLTPSVLLVLLLSAVFSKYSTYPAVRSAFSGIYPVIVGLILFASYKIARVSIKDVTSIAIGIIAFLASLLLHIDPIPLIICGAAAGIAIGFGRSLFKAASHEKINNKEGHKQ